MKASEERKKCIKDGKEVTGEIMNKFHGAIKTNMHASKALKDCKLFK